MSAQGWIKIHRQLSEKSWYKKSEFVHLWLHLLMSATHSARKFTTMSETIDLEAGSFIKTRATLSAETGIEKSKVERILKVFIREDMIVCSSVSNMRKICIKNFEKFQKSDSESEQLQVNKTHALKNNREQRMNRDRTDIEQTLNRDRTDIEQRLNINKNEENEKKGKNEKNEENEVVFLKEKIESENENFELEHIQASKKLIQFFETHEGAKSAVKNGARFSGPDDDFNQEIFSFFAYYSESLYFAAKAIKNPMQITGKFQSWLSKAVQFKKQDNKTQKQKNQVSNEFKQQIKNARENW